MNKKLILKTAFLLIITTACTFKAKAQFDHTATNNTGCSITIEVLDINSTVLYSNTVGAGVTNFSCVGSFGTPTGLRYTPLGSGCGIPTNVIPLANLTPIACTTGCCSCISQFTNTTLFNSSCTSTFNINTTID